MAGILEAHLAVVVVHVGAVYLREVLHLEWLNDTDVCDQTGHCSRRIRTTREAKAADLVASLVVENNEIVRFDDILCKASASSTLTDRLRTTEVAGANSAVVVDYLLPFLIGILLVCAKTIQNTAELCDVGGYVLLVGNTRLPGSIATDDETSAPGLVRVGHDIKQE